MKHHVENAKVWLDDDDKTSQGETGKNRDPRKESMRRAILMVSLTCYKPLISCYISCKEIGLTRACDYYCSNVRASKTVFIGTLNEMDR